MAAASSHSPTQIAAMAIAICAAVAIGGMILSSSNVARQASRNWTNLASDSPVAALGVQATLRSGDKSIERTMPTLDLMIGGNAAADEALPSGAFEGNFTVTFAPGKVRNAKIGAEIQGGSLIISRGDKVLASDYADSTHSKVVLTNLPVWLPKRREQIVYQFKSDGGAVKLRAIWQPEDADGPLPLGSDPARQAQARR